MNRRHNISVFRCMIALVACIVIVVALTFASHRGLRDNGIVDNSGNETLVDSNGRGDARNEGRQTEGASESRTGTSDDRLSDTTATQGAGQLGVGDIANASNPPQTDASKDAKESTGDQSSVSITSAEGSEPSPVQGAEERTGNADRGDQPFVLADDAECREGEVLVSVDPAADPSTVERLLESIPGFASQHIDAEDVLSGLVVAALEPGTSVEDAVNAIRNLDASIVEDSQPNYVYYLAEDALVEDTSEGETIEDVPVEEEVASVDEETVDGQPDNPADSPENETISATEPEQNATEGSLDSESSDELSTAAVSTNDPSIENQWNLKSVRAFDAWEITKCEQNVAVAVFDNGFQIDHPDLAGNVIPGSAYNSYDNNSNVSVGNQSSSHGTHVAGIVGAVANNSIGVAGVSYNANIVPVKVFNDSGSSTTSALVRACDYVIEHQDEYNIRVINMSIGSATESDAFEDNAFVKKIKEAYDKGIVTVAAACNKGTNGKDVPFYAYPGDSESVVSVINLKGTAVASGSGNDTSGVYEVSRSSTSNYNCEGQGGTTTRKGKNISAPGASILSTIPTSAYGTSSGTSQASPLVAGVLALEFAANPSLTPDRAVDILYASAHDLGDPGWDREFGYGEVDACEAVRMALSGRVTIPVEGGSVTISLDLSEPFVYDGTQKTPPVVVVFNGEGQPAQTLSAGSDYSVSYQDNIDAGIATVLIEGMGAFEGQFGQGMTFSIEECLISSDMVSLSSTKWTYDAREIRPATTVRHGDKTLVKGTDYTLTFLNNVNAGTGSVTVEGKGNYTGSATKTFSIAPRSIDDQAITATLSTKSLTYTGTAQCPAVVAKHKSMIGNSPSGIHTLTEGTDYTLRYANNVDAGSSATVTITGKGNYANARTLTFSIGRAAITSASVSSATCAYDGSAKTPAVSVRAGTLTVFASGYTVAYANNVRVGTATVKVAGKGNFSGSASTSFQIVKPHVSYRAYVQKVGWQSWRKDGKMAGTKGKSRRMEAIKIKLSDLPYSGGIQYRAHVQNLGWQSWRKDGKMAGTKGKSLRMEAIRIKLYGQMAKHYDVWYRVRAQRYGWMGWAKNGAKAGTTGYSYRLEAIEVVLVPKGGAAPGSTSRPFRSR